MPNIDFRRQNIGVGESLMGDSGTNMVDARELFVLSLRSAVLTWLISFADVADFLVDLWCAEGGGNDIYPAMMYSGSQK